MKDEVLSFGTTTQRNALDHAHLLEVAKAAGRMNYRFARIVVQPEGADAVTVLIVSAPPWSELKPEHFVTARHCDPVPCLFGRHERDTTRMGL